METPKPFDLSHLEQVEAVLGVALKPKNGEHAITKHDIRGFAYTTVVRGLQRAQGADPIEGFSDAVVARLADTAEIQRLAVEVRTANDTLDNWHNPPSLPPDADAPDTPRARFQGETMHQLIGHSQLPPMGEATADNPYRGGYLTVAPPGGGKTPLQANMVRYAGVGEPVSDRDPRIRKAVGIVPSQVLARQMLDPSETLQRFLHTDAGTITVGAFMQGRRNGHDEVDFLLTTPNSYAEAVASGAIKLGQTTRFILDEAHRIALAPGMQEPIGKFGADLYMFTATAAIARGTRDLRRMYPHAQFGTMRGFIEDGILSPLRLYTHRAGAERDSDITIATSLAADYVKSGRKTMIVCEPGESLLQARIVADHLNHMAQSGLVVPHQRFDWDHSKQLASAIGQFPGSTTKKDIALFKQNERLILTTVATGMEGLDIPDLDAIIFLGAQSDWQMYQWLGRVLRPSGRMAIAAEILPYEQRVGAYRASIYSPFIGPHQLIVPGYTISAQGSAPNEQAIHNHSPGGVPTGSGASRPPQPPREQYDDYQPPSELQSSLVTSIPLRNATIAPADLAAGMFAEQVGYNIVESPSPGFAMLNIPLPSGLQIEWVYDFLDRLKDPAITYESVWQADEYGVYGYQRYYSPATHAYIETHGAPQLVGDMEMLDEDMARLLHVSRHRVKDIIDALGLQPLPRVSKMHRQPRYFGIDAYLAVAAEIEKFPLADETDEALIDIGEETTKDFAQDYVKRHTITAIEKRRNPAWGVVGVALHVTAAQANAIREAYERLEVADRSKVMSFTEIATRSGVSFNGFLYRFNAVPETARPPIQSLREAPGAPASSFVDRTWGEAFIEYIKPEKLLPWEATGDMIAAYFGIEKTNIGAFLRRRGYEPITILPLPGVKHASIYPLVTIVQLESRGNRGTAWPKRLDIASMAFSENQAADETRVRNSQALQAELTPAKRIAEPDEIAYYMARREHPPQLPQLQPIAHMQAMSDALPIPPHETTAMPAPIAVLFESLRDQTRCTPEAFDLLLDYAGVSPQTEPNEEAVERINQTLKTIDNPIDGWTSLNLVARMCGQTSREAVMQAAAAIAAERGEAISLTELDIARTAMRVEVYISPAFKRAIYERIMR